MLFFSVLLDTCFLMVLNKLRVILAFCAILVFAHHDLQDMILQSEGKLLLILAAV